MKIAILSDIHSNVFALEAVLADAKSKNVDILINLGDILYGPIAPKATYELLKKNRFITISGNQDRQIVEASQEEIKENATLAYILEDLGSEGFKWLKELPFDTQFNEDIYLCHATPKDDLTYLLEDTQSGYNILKNDKEILKLLGNNSSKVILCGHTHIPRKIYLSTGQLIINPGSVGLQAYKDDEPWVHCMQRKTPEASYAILEYKNNTYTAALINVVYNYSLAINEAKKRKREDWMHYLKTGKEYFV
ncbi:MAG: metallophosphoesterase family protein [Campylobacteraceae bacterium]|nr:metallophosphoesterase family protein [Campylobacteraceae bacterium]